MACGYNARRIVTCLGARGFVRCFSASLRLRISAEVRQAAYDAAPKPSGGLAMAVPVETRQQRCRTWRKRLLRRLKLFAVTGALALAGSASAATITVNSTDDTIAAD